jgi:hypothetical protein
MRFLPAIILAFLSFVAMAEDAPGPPDTSLFFTPDESRSIDSLTASLKPNPAATPGIHLGAVFYYGPGAWSIWLRNTRWTPETTSEDLRVVDVSANKVDLEWISQPGSDPVRISLRPYQTYQISSGKIIEGR